MSIQALRRGAYDMLTKPFEPDELIYRVKNALQHHALVEENRELKEELTGKFRFDRIIGASAAIQALLEKVAKVAVRDTGVLITGESGTGKELVARYLLAESPRARRPFVAFNAAAVHPNLIESELFGFKKGAFTGADRNSPGYVGAAEGGTLFIDEIGEMPLALQPKLLRFMQEREYLPVGASTPVHSDVRVIAATNKDLEKEIVRDHFRQDLYYRISRFTLRVPSLRERREDIPPLVKFFVERFSAQYKKDLRYPDEAAMARFTERDWPGNIRELEHAVARWVLTAGERPEPESAEPAGEGATPAAIYSFRLGEKNMKEIEKEVIEATLRFTTGNKGKTAQMLGISERTIYRKMTGDEEL
jgi:DNA-binding NtrC family response regulator